MKVMYIHDYPDFGGGAEASLHLLVTHIQACGVEPSCALPVEGTLAPSIARMGISVFPISLSAPVFRSGLNHAARSSVQILASSQQISRLVRLHSPHVVHANSMLTALCAAVPCGRTNTPLICHVRLLPRPSAHVRMALRFLSLLGTTFIAISRAVSDRLQQLGVKSEQIRLLYNAVDVDAFDQPHPTLREDWGIELNRPLVGLVGQFARHKGQDVFIKAASLVNVEFPDAQFAMIGKTVNWSGAFQYQPGELEAAALKLLPADRVHFIEHQTNIAAAMKSLDVLVVPSRFEPFGRVVIEGMAAGIPIVASNVDGIAEIITDGVDGLLVPPDEPHLLGDAIMTLLRNPSLQTTLRQQAQIRVREQFAVDRHLNELIAIYAQCTRGSTISGGRAEARSN